MFSHEAFFCWFFDAPRPPKTCKNKQNHCSVVRKQGFQKIEKASPGGPFWLHLGAILEVFERPFLIFVCVFFRDAFFAWFLVAPGPPRTCKNKQNHCSVLRKQGFQKIEKNEPQSPVLPPFWTYFWGLWLIFLIFSRFWKRAKKHRKKDTPRSAKPHPGWSLERVK